MLSVRWIKAHPWLAALLEELRSLVTSCCQHGPQGAPAQGNARKLECWSCQAGDWTMSLWQQLGSPHGRCLGMTSSLSNLRALPWMAQSEVGRWQGPQIRTLDRHWTLLLCSALQA